MVKKMHSFRDDMETSFELLEQVSANIMDALEVALKLPSNTFRSKITNAHNASEMRLNHYPSISMAELHHGDVSRIWPHFDLGVITLLFQDNVGGLEFENRKQPGTFHRVPCESQAEMIVNVSETLQRWSNDRLPAGLHRVTIPEAMENEIEGVVPERYSIAYFTKADRDTEVGPLQPFVHADGESRYQNMTAFDYHQMRLKSAY